MPNLFSMMGKHLEKADNINNTSFVNKTKQKLVTIYLYIKYIVTVVKTWFHLLLFSFYNRERQSIVLIVSLLDFMPSLIFGKYRI